MLQTKTNVRKMLGLIFKQTVMSNARKVAIYLKLSACLQMVRGIRIDMLNANQGSDSAAHACGLRASMLYMSVRG